MPRATRADLVREMEQFGETVPKCWTIPEIESRLQEIYEEQGMVRHKGKIQTPLRNCIVEPNRHSKRKSDLQDYVENHLRIHITRNETIGELKKAIHRAPATTCFGHAASSCSHARSRSPAPRPRDEQADVASASPWWSQQSVQESALSTDNSFWCDDSAAVGVEIEMPQSRSRSERALTDLPAFLAYNLKRRAAIEVSERCLTPEEEEQFRSGPRPWRWPLTLQSLPKLGPSAWDGSLVGKLRGAAAVVQRLEQFRWELGYQDPSYERRATHSPTTTRQTR